MKPTAVLVLAVLLAGCGSAEEKYDPNAGLESCKSDDCEEQIADLQAQVEKLPEIESAGLRYFPGKPALGPLVTGTVHLASADPAVCEEIADGIGKLAWNSDVAPIDGIDLDCFPSKATNSEYLDVSWILEPESFRDSWGERG